jgi:biopolymer transport protein ExbB
MSETVLQLAVQGTLVALVISSVLTWAIVLVKGLQWFRARLANSRFLRVTKNDSGLPNPGELAKSHGPLARLAQAGVASWREVRFSHGQPGDIARDVLELRLKQQIQRERRTTERGLAVLASIGSTSPFIGLFGTVWGIMGALGQIGSTGSAGLEVVAGPIGEALIATGFGIAVAVPAVIAFNFFVRGLKVQAADLEDFANSIVSLALQDRLDTRTEEDTGQSGQISGNKSRRSSELVNVRAAAAPREVSA